MLIISDYISFLFFLCCCFLLQPVEVDSVNIQHPILIDESPPSLKNITIHASGSLIFDPEVEMELRAMNIFVYGSMEIGSEDCRYNKSLTITLTGNLSSFILFDIFMEPL